MKETIRDFGGSIIGYIETESNGDKKVTDFYGKTLGYYDAGTNTTRDFYKRIIARGDICGIFFKNDIDF